MKIIAADDEALALQSLEKQSGRRNRRKKLYRFRNRKKYWNMRKDIRLMSLF